MKDLTRPSTILVSIRSAISRTFALSIFVTVQKGFDLSTSVQTLENITKVKMELEKTTKNYTKANSLIGLFVTRQLTIEQTQKQYVIQRINEVIKLQIPGIKRPQ